jgi:hypothetical protein
LPIDNVEYTTITLEACDSVSVGIGEWSVFGAVDDQLIFIPIIPKDKVVEVKFKPICGAFISVQRRVPPVGRVENVSIF